MSDITDKIIHYEERKSQVISTRDDLYVEVFLTKDVPDPGHGVRFLPPGDAPVVGLVERHLGQNRVEVRLLSPRKEVAPGVPAEPIHETINLPSPQGDTFDLQHAMFTADPGGLARHMIQVPFAQLEPTRPALETGIEQVDFLSPLTGHGVNLIIDQSEAFGKLATRIASNHAVETIVVGEVAGFDGADFRCLVPEQTGGEILAIEAGVAWAVRWREEQRGHLLFVAELPCMDLEPNAMIPGTPSGREMRYSELIDWIGESLTSRRGAMITVMLRLRIGAGAAGLDAIIETMRLGDVDAQVYVDQSGTYDPLRSRSGAERDPEITREALDTRQRLSVGLQQFHDRADLFGEEDLFPEDYMILTELSHWKATIE